MMAAGAAGRAERGSVRLILFLIVAAGLMGMLIVYTVRHRRPPIPADADHLRSTEASQCLSCHGPGAKRPRGPDHPLNDQCFSCHERV